MGSLQQLKDTFTSGKTRALTWRKAQLQAMQQLLVDNEQAIYAALKHDLNKCEFESYVSEYEYILKDIALFSKNLKRWSRPRPVPTPLLAQPGSSKLLPEPYGVVLIMGAWNYPLQLVLSAMVAAIAAGNCVVLKPSELAGAVSNLIATLIPKYLDTSAFLVVEGGVEETTALLQHSFDHILYTGSETVGKIVMRAASEHLTPVTLELGGKSPCIVDESTNLAVTADRIIWGKFLNAGQTCIAPDYILVPRSQSKALVEALKASLRRQYGEDPKQSQDFGRIINERHFQRIAGYLEGMSDQVITGGQVDAADKYIAPTLLMNPALDAPMMSEEIFGPLLPIVEVDDVAAAIEFINRREKPLALYLFSQSQKSIDAVTEQTSAGTLCINDAVIFMINHHLPFGGVGNSGMGAYHGKWGFDTFSHLKPVMHRSFLLDAPIRYAPFTPLKQKLLKLLNKL